MRVCGCCRASSVAPRHWLRRVSPRGCSSTRITPGDTVRVSVRVVEGERERVQAFEGVCIARKNAGINSNFTLRKISYGEGVERIFPLYSPRISAIEVVRRGAVRRAKLYYLRSRRGKSARIAERGREDNRRERVPVTGSAETEA